MNYKCVMSNRRAKQPINSTASEAANKLLYNKFPELKGRKLKANSPEDYKYRQAWMDAYVAAGGEVEKNAEPVPVKATKKECPADHAKNPVKEKIPKDAKYDILELVEVIDQGEEKWVKGVGMDTSDIAEKIVRSDKDGSDFKQYINIKQDCEGKDKRHPEYGRVILFKAKIKQTSGPKKLNGIPVKFSFNKTDGPNKTDANVWQDKNLTADQKEGFRRANGSVTAVMKTNDQGWTTSAIPFYVSAYGGDKFEICAELHPSVPGAGKKIKTNHNYVVWKKFWYQLTYAEGFAAKVPVKAEAAYKEVFTEMVKSGEKQFKKANLPDDLQDRTFYKEFMLKQGGGNGIVATVGSNNKTEFAKKPIFDKDEYKEHPIKANVIACNYQCDAMGATPVKKITLTANGQKVIMPGGVGSIICKPALARNKKLVFFGEWSKTKTPWKKQGKINDDAIIIDSGRSDTLGIKIDLSKGATGSPPVPTATHPVYVRLRVQSAEDYLGESFDPGQVLCVYRPGTADPKQGSEADFNDTVAHELGHMWNQTPPVVQTSTVPASLKAHPLRYEGHGGQGPHCRDGVIQYWRSTGLSNTPGPVNWSNRNQKLPEPLKGTCIMFGTYSSKCSHKFCSTCKPYLQLQDMQKIMKTI